jgi:hypothetical protein
MKLYPSSCKISAQICSKPGNDVARSSASRTTESVLSVPSFKEFQDKHKHQYSASTNSMFTLITKTVFSLKTHLKIVTHRLDFNKVKSTRATCQITMHSTLYSSLSARTCEIVDRIIYLSFYWHKCVKSLQKRVSLKLLHRKSNPYSVPV